MTPYEFQQLLDATPLMVSERDKAWRLYKAAGPEAAVKHVLQVRQQQVALKQNLALLDTPAPYSIWGRQYIESGALDQMNYAARLPIAVAGALMPDAHQGYGLPIGGVLATDNAVIPYAVGVDIACRMMLTVYPAIDMLDHSDSSDFHLLKIALINNTVFGSGREGLHDGTIDHPILDPARWKGTSLIRSLHQTAVRQIGTSGTGNHFVEWGELKILEPNNPLKLPVGRYLALLSHSGSRGVGYKIASHFTEVAMQQMSTLDASVKHLAWLPLDTEAGQEYWNAMHLAGEFASANHHVIHERVATAVGLKPIATIENHHNFAWRETIEINGIKKEVIVHRKGATPAGHGVLGIIPGTMADPGFVVAGKGNRESLNSASHGSGRQMSRTKAKQLFTKAEQSAYLAERGVRLIGGGLDESPQAYKPIQNVIDAQKELVDILGAFQPRLVRMAEDDSYYRHKPVPKGIVDAEKD